MKKKKKKKKKGNNSALARFDYLRKRQTCIIFPKAKHLNNQTKLSLSVALFVSVCLSLSVCLSVCLSLPPSLSLSLSHRDSNLNLSSIEITELEHISGNHRQ